ncbi:MAG: hypothetical protein H7A51_13795 [Akkermansiaceae bacterium]|nr:hypothetical protein [Akkermansiaceae bacterium]
MKTKITGITFFLVIFSNLHILAGLEEFRNYDYIVIYEEYDATKDSFKKKTSLGIPLDKDTSQMMEIAIKASCRSAQASGDEIRGHIYLGLRGDHGVKFYVIRDRNGEKVFRWNNDWIKLKDLIRVVKWKPAIDNN